MPTVSTVENTTSERFSRAERSEDAREVTRVAAPEPHRPIEDTCLAPAPGELGSNLGFEVVPHVESGPSRARRARTGCSATGLRAARAAPRGGAGESR